MQEPPSLRLELRRRTRVDHERVDAAFSRLDLTDPQDYRVFLRAHFAAHDALHAALPHMGAAPASRPVPDMRDLIVDDLKVLGAVPTSMAIPDVPSGLSPLGAFYVVAGSSLGSQILRRQWEAGSNARVLGAGRYLSSQRLQPCWKSFQMDVANLPLDDKLMAAIDEAARWTFNLFTLALSHSEKRLRS